MSDDPNHIMTPEEIEALLAQVPETKVEPVTDEDLHLDEEPLAADRAAEEKEIIAEAGSGAQSPLSDDPNHMMSPEEIAALINGESFPPPEPEPEPVTEPEPELIPEPEIEPMPEFEEAEAEPLPDFEPMPEFEEEAEAEPLPDFEPMPELEPEPEPEPEPAAAAAPASDDSMSEDEIAKLLDSIPELADEAPESAPAAEAPVEEAPIEAASMEAEPDDKDVTDIIDSMPEDDELSEINALLKQSDGGTSMADDDVLALLDSMEGGGAPDSGASPTGGGESAGEAEEDEGDKKKKKKKEKKPKAEPELGPDGKPIKKPGLLQKIIGLFFDEDEPDEDDAADGASEATRENRKVIAEAEENDKNKKKKKKEKKPKEKKEKKEKKPKEKKPKKPKPPKPEEPPGKKIPKKKILAVAIFFISLLAMILVCLAVFPKTTYVNVGKSFYKEGNYEAAYETLAGIKGLDADTELMYINSAMIMRLQRKLDSYTDFMSREKPLEALDSLIQGVSLYNYLLPDAQENGVGEQLTAVYNNILSAMSDTFGLGESDANEILGITDKVKYTLKLMDITNPTWKSDIAQQIDADAYEALKLAEEEEKKAKKAQEEAEQLPFKYTPDPDAFSDGDADAGDEPVEDNSDDENSDDSADEDQNDQNDNDQEDYQENNDNGGNSDDGDLLYEFNVTKGKDGTYR